MNSALSLPNSLISQLPLPHNLPLPPNLPPLPAAPLPAPVSQAPPLNNTVATPSSMQDHNSSMSGSEAHLSSPLRGPAQDKPENGNGMRINYEGRVSVLAHAPIYGSGNGNGNDHVTTTLDDSREERGWTTDEQTSPGKEQSSSPDGLLPKSSDGKSETKMLSVTNCFNFKTHAKLEILL